MGGEPEDQVQA